MKVHHLNGGVLHAPPHPRASCHCLLLDDGGRLALVDTGIGLLDVADPVGRIGQPLIDIAGFQFDEQETVIRNIERLGFRAEEVADVVLTHVDPDHTGGLADFPDAAVHLSLEERTQLQKGHWRYLAGHFAHKPHWRTHAPAADRWFGLEARWLPIGSGGDVALIPLFGHTLGHCGVAVRDGERWLLHVGDAYYLRVELTRDDHPVSTLAAQRADDDTLRRTSLNQLRRLAREHSTEIQLCGYHDFTEFPDPAAETDRIRWDR